jgi:glycosyltransferase involved in cell wall biosynthesis
MTEPALVLHVFGRMQRGGAELRTLDVMRAMGRDRARFHFCALTGLPGELDDEIRRLGGEVHLVRLGPAFLVRFLRLLHRLRPKVVHSHVFLFSGVVLALARAVAVPVRVAHFRSMGDGVAPTAARRAWTALLRALLDASATHILAVSRGAMAFGWREGWERDRRCAVVYNGIDAAPYRDLQDRNAVLREFGLPPDARLVVHVGRIDPAKNHALLLRIFERVAAEEPAARLVLVGRGGNALEAALRSDIAATGLGDRVVFAGLREDVPRVLCAADLMIFPSIREGLPGAVLEACAAGVPVIATNLPGVVEIAVHFPSVTPLPLSAPVERWAEESLTILRGYAPAVVPIEATPFSLASCVERLAHVWIS